MNYLWLHQGHQFSVGVDALYTETRHMFYIIWWRWWINRVIIIKPCSAYFYFRQKSVLWIRNVCLLSASVHSSVFDVTNLFLKLHQTADKRRSASIKQLNFEEADRVFYMRMINEFYGCFSRHTICCIWNTAIFISRIYKQETLNLFYFPDTECVMVVNKWTTIIETIKADLHYRKFLARLG